MRRALLALFPLLFATPAWGDSLTVTKTATVISDPLGYTLVPRSLPGAIVDYKVLYQNPSGNFLKPVRNLVTEDVLPANVVLNVGDLAGAGKGPVEFVDGGLLGLGASGLGYSFASLASSTDGLEFYNGTTWAYTPQPDAAGYDPAVRAIRVTTTATFATNTSFQLRYRVKIR